MTKAVVPVVAVMLGVLTWEFVQSSIKGLKWFFTTMHIIVALVLIEYFGIHPGFLIGALLVIAVVKPTNTSKKRNKQKGLSA
jgi:chromate transporter